MYYYLLETYPMDKNEIRNFFSIHLVNCFVCKLFRSRRENPFMSDGFDK